MSTELVLVVSDAAPSNVLKGKSAWNKVMGPQEKSSKSCTNKYRNTRKTEDVKVNRINTYPSSVYENIWLV